MSPVTRRAGVTSKPKFASRGPGGVRRTLRSPRGLDAVDVGDLGRVPLLDGDLLHARRERPVDARGGQGHVEGHVVVVGGEGLEVGADLVGDVAGRGRAVAADDARGRPGRAASGGRRRCRR